MAADHHLGPAPAELVDGGEPGLAIGLADEWDAAGEHQVAHQGRLVFGHDQRQVFRGMRRADVDDREMQTARLAGNIAVEPEVGRDDAGVLVAPGRERLPPFRQPEPGRVGSEIVARGRVRPDLGARRLQRLQAVAVIRMEMAHDDAAHRLIGDRADRRHQCPAQRRRAERIDHDHAVVRDHECRVGVEALVGARHLAGHALNVAGVGGDLRGHGPGPRPAAPRARPSSRA